MTSSHQPREIKYQGPIFNVVKVKVSLPDKRERDYDLIEHGDSVSILPIDENGNVISKHLMPTIELKKGKKTNLPKYTRYDIYTRRERYIRYS